MERSAVDAEVARLTAPSRSRRRAAPPPQSNEAAQGQEASLRHKAYRLKQAITQRIDTRGDAFRMTVDGQALDRRADAGAHHAAAVAELMQSTGYGQTRSATIGQLPGFDVEVEVARAVADEVTKRMADGLVEARWPLAKGCRRSTPPRYCRRAPTLQEDEREGAVTAGEKVDGEATRQGASPSRFRARTGAGGPSASAARDR